MVGLCRSVPLHLLQAQSRWDTEAADERPSAMPQVLVLKQCFLDKAKYLAGFAVQSIPAYSFTIFVSAIRHLRSPAIAGHSWTQQTQRHPFTHLLSLQGGGGWRFRPSTQRAKPWARGVANCRLRVASHMQWPQALVCEKKNFVKIKKVVLGATLPRLPPPRPLPDNSCDHFHYHLRYSTANFPLFF